MLVTMAILSTVMASVTGLFVAGTRAQVDMNERFQGQQEARLPPPKKRRGGDPASRAPGRGAAGARLTRASYCKTGSGQVSWCSVAFTGSTTRYRLFRKTGATCDATGVRWA